MVIVDFFIFRMVFFSLKLLGLTGYLFWWGYFFMGGSIDGSNVGIDGLLVLVGLLIPWVDRPIGRMLGLTGYLFWWGYR